MTSLRLNLSVLESMPTFLPQVLVAAVSLIAWALMDSGWRWVPLVIAVVVGGQGFLNLAHKLSPPWKRVHFPFVMRYTKVYMARAALVGEPKELSAFREPILVCMKLAVAGLGEGQAERFVDIAHSRMQKFTDKVDVVIEGCRRKRNVTPERMAELITRRHDAIMSELPQSLFLRYAIAELVEAMHGQAERNRYLWAVYTNEAY